MLELNNFRVFLWFALVLMAFFSQRLFVVAQQPYRSGRIGESKCKDAQTGRELLIGDAFTRPGQCVRVQCLGNLQIWEDSCQVPSLKGNCTRLPSANEYLEYPRCCPMYECITYETNDQGEVEETRTYDHYGILRKTHITQVFIITNALTEKVPGSVIKTQFEI